MRKAPFITALVVGAILVGSSAEAAAKNQPAQPAADSSGGNEVIERVTQLPEPAPPLPLPMAAAPLAQPLPMAAAPTFAPPPQPAPSAVVSQLPPPPPPAPPVQKVPVWVAPEGAKLRAVLAAWAEEAGWKLVWDTEYSYTLRASVEFEGSFEKASQTLIEAFSKASPPIFADFNDGNRVIVITTPRDQDVN